ncbi:acyl carrier protein [Acidithiobacillus ferrivorans]|nr:acyl carrier protein [Acidithiobacillus ferrivorans]
MTTSIADRVRTTIAKQLGINPDNVTDDSIFTDDLAADSLDMVEITMALEEEFECEIPDEDMENTRTISDAVKVVEQVLNANQ